MVARKYAINVSDFLALLAGMVLVWSFLSYQFPDIRLVSKVGWLVGYVALIFTVLIGVSAYLDYLRGLLRGAALSVAPLLIGLAFVQFILLQDARALVDSGVVRLSALALVFWFWVSGYRIAEIMTSKFPISENEMRKVMTRFPPQSFHDMWPFHIFIIFLLLFMPFVIRLIWKA